MKRPYTKQLYELIYKHTRIKPDPQVFLGMVARAQTVDTGPFFFCDRPGYEAMISVDHVYINVYWKGVTCVCCVNPIITSYVLLLVEHVQRRLEGSN